MNLTETFARSLQAFAACTLDEETRKAAVALFVDGLAVAALGADETGPTLIADLAIEAGGYEEATLIRHGRRSSIVQAARTNGASMHALDFEPMWNPANHALSTTLPAVLALAEREAGGTGCIDSPIGLRLLTALAAGIEAQARLRLSSGQFEPADLVFHPPGAVGPIGSAVACSIFLGFNTTKLVHAIGIATSRASGILANVGSMTKALHCGQAAAAGLESALLAGRGFTADADALAGPRGFGSAFFRDGFSPETLVAPRHVAHIVDPGPAYKLYPSQYGTHFVICAAREAHRKLPSNVGIRSVRIISPSMPYVDRPSPESGLAGKFSFQYTAAAALLDGNVTPLSFTNERRFAPDMIELLPKIAVVPDPKREGRFDRMRLDMSVECDNGQRIDTTCDGPPGIWGRPAPDGLLAQKAHECLETAYGAETGERILCLAENVSHFGSRDLRTLMGLLKGTDSSGITRSEAQGDVGIECRRG
jgi:aconitate decarboxylase